MTPGETVVVSCAAVTALMLASFLSAVSSAPAPRVILRFETGVVVCAVPPRAENRWVELSVDGDVLSGRSLDAETETVYVRRPIPPADCEAGTTRTAACRLTFQGAGGTQYAVDRQPFLCRPADSPIALDPSRLAIPVLFLP